MHQFLTCANFRALSRFDSGTTALFFAFSVERLGQILAAFFDFVKFLKINFSTGSTGS